MLGDFLLIFIGLIALFIGGDWLVKGASRIALSFGVSTLIVGLTIVSIGTSAPELLVSLKAAFDEAPGIALGNVIGSNIANIGFILGIAGLITPIAVKIILVKREIPLMIGFTVGASLLALDGGLSRFDGVMMLLLFAGFNFAFYLLAQREHDRHEAEHANDEHDPADNVNRLKELGRLLIGIAALALGANWLVDGATSIAREIGVSELVIGVTMVAFGTSLPELATSVVAAMRKEADIIVGNVIGSNIANLLLILGATSLVSPIDIVMFDEFLVMLAFSALLLPFALDRVLSRRESAFFLGAYAIFVIYTFII